MLPALSSPATIWTPCTPQEDGGTSRQVLSTLLCEMDGIEGQRGVLVVGCSNQPKLIDGALLRQVAQGQLGCGGRVWLSTCNWTTVCTLQLVSGQRRSSQTGLGGHIVICT